VSAAARRSILFGGSDTPPVQKKIGGSAGAEVRISHTCFKSSSAKNFCYQGMHAKQLFVAAVWPQILKNILNTIIKTSLQ